MAATIRQARPGDGDAITRAWLSAGRYYADIDPERFQVPEIDGRAPLWDDRVSQSAANSLCLVAEIDGQVIGCLTARLMLPEPHAASQLTRDQGRTRLAIDALVVTKDYWRHGAGAALYEQRMGYQRRGIVFEKPL